MCFNELIENILNTNSHVPALTDVVVRNPSLGVAVNSLNGRECSITVGVNALVVKDACFAANLRIEILAYTPCRVEEVENILHVEAQLDGVLGVACTEVEVVLVTKVNAVYPWAVNAVTLGILTLMLLQVAVVVKISHETVLIVLRNETELTISNLLIGWDIDSVVVVAVAVHVRNSHVRVVVTSTPSLIDDVVVVATAVVQSSACNETVGGNILRVVQTNVVRTFPSGNIGEGTLGSRTWHTGNFLSYGVSVRSHEGYPVGWLGSCHDVGTPSITLAGVLKNECLGTSAETSRINRTIVSTIEAGEAAYARNRPVADRNSVDSLVEDELTSQCQWERYWECIVNSD